MASSKPWPQAKKKSAASKEHDGGDRSLPDRKPSAAFMAALEAVRATPKKGK